MSSAPAGYIKANGAAVSRTTYSALFTAISTTFGAGDGTTTFNVPDLRGQFLRSWADGSTTYDSGRTLGSTQADDFKSHAHNFTVYSGTGQTGPFFQGNTVYGPRTTDATGGTETRPRNIALLACIKF
jgi:microcystin-dependent protein